MNFANELLVVGVLPCVVAAAVAFGMVRVRASAAVCCAMGIAFGYLAGHIALASRSGFDRALRMLLSPRDASDWLPHGVLLAMGVAILSNYAPRAWRNAPIGLAALLAIGVPARLLAGHLAQKWTALEKFSHLALLSATLALVWLLLAAARDEELPRLRQVLLVLAAAGAALVVTLSGSFSLGRLCGVVAAALTGTALVVPRGMAGAAGIVAVSLGGIILLGVYYSELHAANAALVLLSIVAAGGRMPEAVSRWPAWQQSALRGALCAVPIAIAAGTS